ncbi:MAG: IS110 family transposase [Firmicutes bacterium]|nr:IS110 family transposase [Bacillota bacterium]
MGKGKLGRRGRVFQELFGPDFNPVQLIVIAIDVAKTRPKAAAFDYFGVPLGESFFFTPDQRGIEKVCATADEIANKAGKRFMVFGLENTGHYQEPIVAGLREHNRLVMPINAITTHEERKSLLDYSKTDDLDLYAIAAAVTGGKVTFGRPPEGVQARLRFLTRTRRSCVLERAKAFTDLHTLLDHFWPALQGVPEVVDGKPKLSTIFDLKSDQALAFLRQVKTPAQALALGAEGLARLSLDKRLRLGRRRIGLILQAAELAAKTDESLLALYVEQLDNLLDKIESLGKRIEQLEDQSEEILADTPGVLLLSTPGVGRVTAAEFMAEVGLAIDAYPSASAIIKLAGTNPVPAESGTRRGRMRISKQGNPHLREIVFTIGRNLTELNPNPYFAAFRARLTRLTTNQQRIAVGNKFARVAYAMLTKAELFAPRTWQGPPLANNPLCKLKPQNRAKAQATLERLLRKE